MSYKGNFIINKTEYNLDNSCLFCSTTKGYIIYNINPFREILSKYIIGGLNFGNIYKRTNILYWVGSGVNPEYPTNRLIIWDERPIQKKK